jgi:hypothetical protein
MFGMNRSVGGSFSTADARISYVVNLRAGNSSQLALAGLSTFGVGGVV